jgi:hypothetical protein
MRRTLPAALAAAAALALAGCGGSDSPSDEAAIKSVVRTYFTAFADGDGSKACDQLSIDTRGQIADAAKPKTCAAALTDASRRPEMKQYLDGFRKVEVEEVTVAGNDASAKVKAIGQTTTLPLIKVSGDWRINGTDGAPGS